MRLSRSQSTGMCIQRLSAAARPGLPSAIFFIRSKNSTGKMCGKMSSLRSGAAFFIRLSSISYFVRNLFFLHACHRRELAPARRFGAHDARERRAGEWLGDFLSDVDHALGE